MRAANRTIWAIVWHYSDNSGFGVMRAYSSEESARADMTMFEPLASVTLKVINMPMLDEDSYVE